jgi:hypothetical protein
MILPAALSNAFIFLVPTPHDGPPLSSGDFDVDDRNRTSCQVDEVPNLELDAKKSEFLNQKIDVHPCSTKSGDARRACARIANLSRRSPCKEGL